MSLPDPTVASALDATTCSIVLASDKLAFNRRTKIRKGLRVSATKTVSSLASRLTDLADAKSAHSKLLKLSQDLSKLDGEIADLILKGSSTDDDIYLRETETCESYQDALSIAIQRADLEISSLSTARSGSNTAGGQPPVPSFNPNMSLPKLALPTFDSDPLNYTRFMTQFATIVDKTPYTEYQKFLLLEQSLVGEAQAVVKTPGMHNMTFSDARRALDAAYSDPLARQFACVEKLKSLKMDPKEPFYWFAEAKALREQSGLLGMDADSFVHYFVWSSLPQIFREQLVALTRNARPTLKDIMDNFFDVHHRIKDITSNSGLNSAKVPQKSMVMAGTSETKNTKSQSKQKPISCHLCNSNHSASKCPKYTSPAKKIERLLQLGRCEKCMGDHKGDVCTYVFKFKCGKCKVADHFGSLCTGQNVPPPPSSGAVPTAGQSGSNSSQNSVCSGVTVAMGSTSANVILPSFTAVVQSASGNYARVRAWKDSASQNTLIEEKLARELGLETVKRVNLSLQGFNLSKTFESSKVKLPILIKDEKVEIIATVVPSIDIKLDLSGLDRIIGEFSSCGFSLADEELRGPCVSNGRLLLGSEHSWVLPVHTVRFGTSSYLSSPLGVLLEGDINDILMNIRNLTPYPSQEGNGD